MDISQGSPPEFDTSDVGFPADPRRRNGFYKALADVEPQTMQGLALAMRQTNEPSGYEGGYNDGGHAPTSTGRPRIPLPPRPADSFADRGSNSTFQFPNLSAPSADTQGSANGRATAGLSPQHRFEDDSRQHIAALDQEQSEPGYVTQAKTRLADAMKPHGINALHPTAKNPLLRAAEYAGIGGLRLVDAVGSAAAPGVMEAIPGTTLNEAVKRFGAQRNLNSAVEDELKEAQAGNLRSEATMRRVKPDLETTAAGRRELATQYGLSGEDAVRYILTGQMPVAADKPDFDAQVADRANLAGQYGLTGSDAQRFILTGQLPTETSAQEDTKMQGIKAKQLRGERLTAQESADLSAYEWRKTLGPQASAGAADSRQTRQQQFEIDKEARAQVNGAEKQYRQAKGSADALGDFINLASRGNKIAGAAVPLEGTLEIVTSQGVKRINRTEVEGIEGAGSLFDRIQSKVGKWVKGQPMPTDLLADFKALNDTMRQNSYRAYSDAYDQAKDTYSAYGTDFRKIKKLSPPLKDQVNGGGPAADMVRFQDSQSGVHDIPRANLAKARRRDPGLTVLSQ